MAACWLHGALQCRTAKRGPSFVGRSERCFRAFTSIAVSVLVLSRSKFASRPRRARRTAMPGFRRRSRVAIERTVRESGVEPARCAGGPECSWTGRPPFFGTLGCSAACGAVCLRRLAAAQPAARWRVSCRASRGRRVAEIRARWARDVPFGDVPPQLRPPASRTSARFRPLRPPR